MGGHAGFKVRESLGGLAAAVIRDQVMTRMRAKERNGGSITKTKTMTKSKDILVEPAEFTKDSHRYGRYKRKSLRNAYKLLEVSQQSFYHRFNYLSPWNSVSGRFGMYNHLNTLSNVYTMPIWFAGLHAVTNFAGGTKIVPHCLWNCVRNSVLGTPPGAWTLEAYSGTDNTNSLSLQYQVENTPNDRYGEFPDAAPNRRVIHKWSDIRLMLWGITVAPTKWEVSIVSFPDDEYNPFFGMANENLTGFTRQNQTCDALMDYLVAPYTTSPLNIQDPKLRSKIHFHHRVSYVIQPQFTTAQVNNPTANFKEVRLFQKWDKVLKLDWSDAQTMGDPQSTGFYEQNSGSTYTCPHYRARRYLMLRAIPVPPAGGGGPSGPAFSVARNPSFDLLIRNKFMVNT